jgi:hypothetical protein
LIRDFKSREPDAVSGTAFLFHSGFFCPQDFQGKDCHE